MDHSRLLPSVVDKSAEEIENIIQLIQASELSDQLKVFVVSCIRLAVWLPTALLEKTISLSNLRRLIFGQGRAKQNQRKNKLSDKASNRQTDDELAPNPNINDGSNDEVAASNNDCLEDDKTITSSNRNGRFSHDVYRNATEHSFNIDNLAAGDRCPERCGGKLYSVNPGVLVRIKGQPIASVHKIWIQKLRCSLCGLLIKANVPESIGEDKYDDAFKSQLVLQKYYLAIPFNRQAYYQSLLGVPLPAATQWQLIEEVAGSVFPIFSALETIAANSTLIHNDDTYLNIVDVIHDNRLHLDKARTGMFTTGILAKNGEHDIALFYNGTEHAGENMEKLLAKRAENQDNVIQMCDALSRNIPTNTNTIVCHCLSHAFRKFDELRAFFPEECGVVTHAISQLYDMDDKTRDLSAAERMTYHQAHSTTIIDDLFAYLTKQFDEHLVEPNSALGKAIRYTLKHWERLTQFLRVPGAPLDNNELERTLKVPIRGRRTWLFYKTKYGAMIGGVLTSIIHTCALNNENPFHYLMVLQQHKNQIVKEPHQWLPWNYQQQLTSLSLAA